MFYRIKQFLWAAFERLSHDDMIFVNNYLNEYERELFESLPRYCKVHSVKVARDALDECLKLDLYDIMLIKACLLHDIGKIDCGFNMFTNSVLVLIERFFPYLLMKFKNLKKINVYCNHADIALSYLKNSDNYVKFLIANHHNYEIEGDEKLKILQISDSRN